MTIARSVSTVTKGVASAVTRGQGGGVSYDADSLDYFARAEALGGSFDQTGIDAGFTEVYIKNAIDDFVSGCKADLIWSKLVEAYLFAGVSFSGFLAKLKHNGTATLTNVNFVSGDYVAVGPGNGLAGNASDKRIDTSLVASSAFSAAGASLGIYASGMETGSVSTGFIGVADAASIAAAHSAMFQDSLGRRGVIGHTFNSPVDLVTIAATASANSFEVLSRSSDSNCQWYRNGSPTGAANTGTATGVAAGAIGLFSLRYGSAGSYTYSGFSAMRAKFAFIGLGLSGAEVTNLYARVNALISALTVALVASGWIDASTWIDSASWID